jgi:hypothetical protein
MTHRLILGALGAIGILTACSTPQVALDQASNGVALAQQMQTEVARYRQAVTLAAARRLATVQGQEETTQNTLTQRALADQLDTRSGNTQASESEVLLRDASSGYAKLLSDNKKALKELTDRLAALAQDLPNPADKMATVQKSLAVLGTELSASERLAVVSAFLEDGKKIVDDNKKAAASAAASAASAAASAATPLQPAAPAASAAASAAVPPAPAASAAS